METRKSATVTMGSLVGVETYNSATEVASKGSVVKKSDSATVAMGSLVGCRDV